MQDSLTIDTASMYPALDTARLQLWQAMHQSVDSAKVRHVTVKKLLPDWQKGLEPMPLTVSGADSPWLAATIVTMIMVVILSLRYSHRLFSNMLRQLTGLRSRSRYFDEHTASESRLMLLYGLQCTLYAGILLQAFAARMVTSPDVGRSYLFTLVFIALAGAYYIFSLTSYSVVGYAFTTPEMSRQWLRGFNSTQVFLGFFLSVPALVAVFHPVWSVYCLWTGLGLYILSRVVFIFKGFRIFYSNIGSLLFFILYLCTLEVIPPVILAGVTIFIGSNIRL